MRILLLFVALVATSLPAYACFGGGGDDDPPPQVVRLTGERAACSGLRFVYQVEVANTDQLTLDVVGGTIAPVSAPLTNICGGVPAPSQPSSNRLIYTPNSGNCAFAISAVINWNASGTRRLTATVREGSTTRTRTLTFTGNTPTISGPAGPLCVTDFGGGSFFFSSTGPPGASIQWSTTSGPPLTIASPTSANTNISGFIPSSTYTVQVRYTCPGQSPVSRSLTVQTRSFNDPTCDPFGECPGSDIICREAVAERLEREQGIIVDPSIPDNNTETARIPGQPGTLSGALTDGNDVVFDDRSVAVYPNPILPGNDLTVRLGGATDDLPAATVVRLVDFSGRVLYQISSEQSRLTIPMADVPAGGYLLQTIRNAETTSTKLIVSPNRP